MNEDLKALIDSYNFILEKCSKALAAGVTQETRTQLKEVVDSFLEASKTN